MKFTHTFDEQLCQVVSEWEGKWNDWNEINIYIPETESLHREIVNAAFINKLYKPVSKKIDFDYSSYC